MQQPQKSFFRTHVGLPVAVALLLFGVNAPPVYTAVSSFLHQRKINSQEYKEKYGQWRIIDLPKDMRVNGVHAALLDTGKVLIVAGSGNNRA
ncbi:MAG TPA: galactose oxidase, partial [Rugosimonospora sp.]|nr:galactose oxidase [Rugosimonospora sp.]